MIVEQWIADVNDPKLRTRLLELRQRYEYLSKSLFCEYEPTRTSSRRDEREFMLRLDRWLSQFETDEERIVAFQSIEYLFFAGTGEFDELYRCALESVQRWLMEVNCLDPFTADKLISDEMRKCWFCPITDSLRINSFLHITGVVGHKFRPDWLSSSRFSDKQELKNFVKSENIEYLILLEDFVGSGKQAADAVKFAADALNISTLVLPLIVCSPGLSKLERLANTRNNVWIKPIVTMPKNCLVLPTVSDGEPQLFSRLRIVIKNHFGSLKSKSSGGEFGYGKVGSMVVMYSNCPNNTLPIYHKSRKAFSPLFPRHARPWGKK